MLGAIPSMLNNPVGRIAKGGSAALVGMATGMLRASYCLLAMWTCIPDDVAGVASTVATNAMAVGRLYMGDAGGAKDIVCTAGGEYDCLTGATATGTNLGIGVMLGGGSWPTKTPGQYSVAYETRIPRTWTGPKPALRPAHYRLANQALAEEMAQHPDFAAMMRALDIEVPRGRTGVILGDPIPKWTWHHAKDQPGLMQLTPRGQHMSGLFWPLFHWGDRGGFAEWGKTW